MSPIWTTPMTRKTGKMREKSLAYSPIAQEPATFGGSGAHWVVPAALSGHLGCEPDAPSTASQARLVNRYPSPQARSVRSAIGPRHPFTGSRHARSVADVANPGTISFANAHDRRDYRNEINKGWAVSCVNQFLFLLSQPWPALRAVCKTVISNAPHMGRFLAVLPVKSSATASVSRARQSVLPAAHSQTTSKARANASGVRAEFKFMKVSELARSGTFFIGQILAPQTVESAGGTSERGRDWTCSTRS